jgi:hypothetical protein
MRCLVAVMVAVLAAGCGDEVDAPRVGDGVTPEPVRVDEVVPAGKAPRLRILVNTPDELYQVDPVSFDVTRLGAFTFTPGEAEVITDVAMDRRGRMWAIGFTAVYRVDPKTLACTLLARHPGRALNALSILTAAMMTDEREVPDVLLAGEAYSRNIYRVDPATGALDVVGDLGGNLGSGGDLTWAPGVGAVMIVTDAFGGYEGIAALAPRTFTATPIGPGWPFRRVRGLTFLPDGLLGASEFGELIKIDPATGAGTVVRSHNLVFYGGAIGWDP